MALIRHGRALQGQAAYERVQGGLLGDALSSFFAALATSMPNTTFSQVLLTRPMHATCWPCFARPVTSYCQKLAMAPSNLSYMCETLFSMAT